MFSTVQHASQHQSMSTSDNLFVSFGKAELKLNSLTLSLLMSYIYGAPSKARNLTYIHGQDFLLEILLLEPCISLIYA
jgi:hypothetical protein